MFKAPPKKLQLEEFTIEIEYRGKRNLERILQMIKVSSWLEVSRPQNKQSMEGLCLVRMRILEHLRGELLCGHLDAVSVTSTP